MKTGSRLKSSLQLRPGGDPVGSWDIKIPLLTIYKKTLIAKSGNFGDPIPPKLKPQWAPGPARWDIFVDKPENLTNLENFTRTNGVWGGAARERWSGASHQNKVADYSSKTVRLRCHVFSCLCIWNVYADWCRPIVLLSDLVNSDKQSRQSWGSQKKLNLLDKSLSEGYSWVQYTA